MPAVSATTPSPTDRVAATLKVLLALAFPMVLARATQSVMTAADTAMVKGLGQEAIAATATGGLNVYAFMMLPWGTVFIVQSFVSQKRGRGELDDVARYAWYGLALAALTALVGLIALPFIDPIVAAFDYAPGVKTLMSSYMKIRLMSIGAMIGMEAFGAWYGGLGNTWISMIAGVIAMVANVFLNWVFIYGHLGAPAMGVAGTALASAIGSWLGFGFLAFCFWRRLGGAPKKTGKPLGVSLREFRRVLRFGLPNGFNWFLEFGAFNLFVNFVMSGLGTSTLASFNVVMAVNSLVFMPAFGLASGGAILSAAAIGRNDKNEVWPMVKLTLKCTSLWVVLVGTIYILMPHRLLSWFAPPGAASSELLHIGSLMLALSIPWLLFDAASNVLTETLRGAGDTKWIASARIILAWTTFILPAVILVRYLHAGTAGAMLSLIAYTVILVVALGLRFGSGKWRSIEMIEPALVE